MLLNASAYNGEPRPLKMSEGNTVGSLMELSVLWLTCLSNLRSRFRDDPVTTEAERPRRWPCRIPANLWPLQYADPSLRMNLGRVKI